MQRTREPRSEGGFTFVELLVVVVILGVLLAIALPLYRDYENGARSKAAASDVRAAVSGIEACNSNENAIPAADFTTSTSPYALCPSQTLTLAKGTTLAYWVDSTADAYLVAGYRDAGGAWYCFNSAAGGSLTTEDGPLPSGYGSC